MFCLALLSATTAMPDADVFELPERLGTLLDTGTWDETPRGFRIITLSHVADGCAGQALAHPSRRDSAKACVARVLTQAWKTMPAKSVEQVVDGLWLSHVNLILADADQLGVCPSPAVHRQVSQQLAAMSLADRHAHAPSYASARARWPADQSVTLASLARYDRAHGAHLSDRPIAAWKAVVAKKPGLPVSEVVGVSSSSKFSRGCANAFLTRYTAEFAPDLAHTWWLEFRRDWVMTVGPFTGFREWPLGVERTGDVDSGPIIMGIGTAASALSISAARAQGDTLFAVTLEASAAQVMALGVAGGVPTLVLADAISFQGHWQPTR